MRQLFTIVLFLPLFSFAQQTYVPDDNFEQALINQGYDTVLDDSVLTNAINELTSLTIIGLGISDLTGIEDFSAIELLSFNLNYVTEIDLSQNTALSILSFHHNSISEIDLSNNSALTIFTGHNNNLTSLDFSANPNMVVVQCEDNNLSSLNIANNTNSISSGLYTAGNPSLECILVSDSLWAVENYLNIDPQHYFSTTCSAVGLDEPQNSFSLFPIPTRGQINFSEKLRDLNVYDLSGRLMYSATNSTSIDITTFKSGVYYIEAINESGQNVNRRILKMAF